MIKSAVGIGGGAAGIGMIIAGIGGALGWGAGGSQVFRIFRWDFSLTDLRVKIVCITLAGIAAYFATTSNEAKDTERFMNVLKFDQSRC